MRPAWGDTVQLATQLAVQLAVQSAAGSAPFPPRVRGSNRGGSVNGKQVLERRAIDQWERTVLAFDGYVRQLEVVGYRCRSPARLISLVIRRQSRCLLKSVCQMGVVASRLGAVVDVGWFGGCRDVGKGGRRVTILPRVRC